MTLLSSQMTEISHVHTSLEPVQNGHSEKPGEGFDFGLGVQYITMKLH